MKKTSKRLKKNPSDWDMLWIDEKGSFVSNYQPNEGFPFACEYCGRVTWIQRLLGNKIYCGVCKEDE